MENHDVIIVGGGPTGLSAARRLADLGIRDVVVLEREAEAGGFPELGGKARSAPQAPVALPAKAQMAAMAGNAARLGLAFKDHDITNAQIGQAARRAQAGGAATHDDHIMAFHQSAPC